MKPINHIIQIQKLGELKLNITLTYHHKELVYAAYMTHTVHYDGTNQD